MMDTKAQQSYIKTLSEDTLADLYEDMQKFESTGVTGDQSKLRTITENIFDKSDVTLLTVTSYLVYKEMSRRLYNKI